MVHLGRNTQADGGHGADCSVLRSTQDRVIVTQVQEHVRANVGAAGWELTEEDRAELDRIAPSTFVVWGSRTRTSRRRVSARVASTSTGGPRRSRGTRSTDGDVGRDKGSAQRSHLYGS